VESVVNEFHTVLGQYLDYHSGIEEQEPDRMMYVAIPDKAWERILKLPFLLRMLVKYHVNTAIFDTAETKINQWIIR
jgi:hypothetical protein